MDRSSPESSPVFRWLKQRWDNPVFVREMRRRKLWLWLPVAGVASLVLSIAYPVIIGSLPRPGTLSVLLLPAWVVLWSGVPAAIVTVELCRGSTEADDDATPVEPLDVVWGKIVAGTGSFLPAMVVGALGTAMWAPERMGLGVRVLGGVQALAWSANLVFAAAFPAHPMGRRLGFWAPAVLLAFLLAWLLSTAAYVRSFLLLGLLLSPGTYARDVVYEWSCATLVLLAMVPAWLVAYTRQRVPLREQVRRVPWLFSRATLAAYAGRVAKMVATPQQTVRTLDWATQAPTNPVYLRESRRKVMRRARLWAATGTLFLVILADFMLLGSGQWLLIGVSLIALATAGPAGMLLVLSFVTDRRLGHLDELRVTRLTMTEVMRGKLAASVLPFLPAAAAGLLFGWVALTIAFADRYIGAPVLLALLFVVAVGAWALAWAVKCSLWATRWDPWTPLVVYGVGVLALVAAPLLLYVCQSWILTGLRSTTLYISALRTTLAVWPGVLLVVAGACIAWAFHWRGVRRHVW